MKSQLTFTPEVLTCCTLYSHCDYVLTLLVIYEHLHLLKNNLALMTIYSYNLHRHSQKKNDNPSEPGSSLGFFLGSGLSMCFFLAAMILHLNCLLFGVLGWVSV
jgi:hypothetical protein